MGMFDWYKPIPNLNCPNCDLPLDDWQGKDSACALFVWQQGFINPIEQKGYDCNIGVKERNNCRLPRQFRIYNYCENCADFRIEAICKTENEIWTEIIEVKVEKNT